MKKRIMKLFLFIMFIIYVVCLYKVYINYKMIKEIIKQPPIVFSARFKDGDKGTFKYDIQTGKTEKISDYAFQELSYSNDHEKIVGVVWEDKFQGLAELDMKHYTFKPIIDLEELNKCAKEIGLDEIKYNMPGISNIHMPQFYKDGYTFFWGHTKDIICYASKQNDICKMKVLYKSEYGNYSYHIKEKDDKDIIFLESRYEVYSQKIDRLYINKNNLETFGKEELLITPRKNFSSSTGNMDISNDINRVSYYEKPDIYIYDFDTKNRKHVNSQHLLWQDIVYIKFSPDERYIFYAVGDIPFFWTDGYRLIFYIVDIKTGNKIRLDKWKKGDTFYGIDW